MDELGAPATRGRNTVSLRRYLEAYALNSAGVVDHKTIYDAAGIPRSTADAYGRLLTRLFVVEQLPPWTSNRLKRLIRAPKRYLIDAALVGAALRLDVNGILRDGDLLGRILDTFVLSQVRPETTVSELQPRLHYLRTQGGRHEVGLIAELGSHRVIAIEIKASAAPTDGDARHLRWLAGMLGNRFLAGVILYTGPRVFRLADGIIAAPISTLWG